jgi:hypothetical protein
MGELSMHHPDGKKITIQIDGTIIKEQAPLEIDWCDKCQKWQALAGGETTTYQGLSIVWLCQACK